MVPVDVLIGGAVLGGLASLTSLGLVLLIPYAALCLLAPKFYWDSFNGDGAHAFESARLLLGQPVPEVMPGRVLEEALANSRTAAPARELATV